MSILSSFISITRYKVEGRIKAPVLEAVASGLKQNAIYEIDDQSAEKAVGWTSFNNPYQAQFSGSDFVYGNYMVFSMRIDKKSIPSKVVKKYFMIESSRRLAESGRQFLSRSEKKAIKDLVIERLNLKVLATPHVYDLVWNYEDSFLLFFSNLKGSNEELETLFLQSFDLRLIRMFPYTAADLNSDLTAAEKDILLKISPASFTG